MKMSQLLGKIVTITIPYDEDEVTFSYKASAVTLDWLEEAEEFETAEELAEALSEVLVEWDIVDENEEKIKPTTDFIRTLPLRFMRRVFQAIQEDGSLGETRGRNSRSGSRRKGR